MSSRIGAVLATLAIAVAAPAARADFTGASLTLEGFGGWQNLNFSTSNPNPGGTIGSALSGSSGTAIVGGDLLLKLFVLGVGVSVDKTVSGAGPGDFQPWAGSIMLGLLFDLLPSLRVEALGEVGRYGPTSFGDIFDSSGQTFLGVRPGISFRLLPSPIRFGVAALIRWPTSGPTADIGSPNYGFVGRIGLELP